MSPDKDKIEEILTRGVEEAISKENLEKKLLSGQKLRIKLGIDPTSPNIHIGRSIPLLKLRDFQQLGHQIVFIIGDFTGVIGDSSDKESERPMLLEEQVHKNMENYVAQAGKILDINQCEIHRNSEWLDEVKYKELCKQADIFSLNDFISRENIKKRLDEGKRISLREVLYPLMQGYDSVMVKADVEIGGTDQKFNLLAGRDLQRFYNQEPQDIIMNPLVEGLDGRKMSSSWGNTINLLDSAQDMFGKVMSLHDELITKYFTLVTRVPVDEIKKFESLEPKEYKVKLAKEIVKIYHGEKAALEAEENFQKTFSKGEFPDGAQILEVEKGEKIIDAVVGEKLVESKSEFRRLVENGAVSEYPDKKITDPNAPVLRDMKIKIGKKIFVVFKPKTP